jgi:hypothetical protein
LEQPGFAEAQTVTDTVESAPQVPPESDAAIVTWMKEQGWDAAPARWRVEPESGFHVWQEKIAQPGRAHALWISEAMVRQLSSKQLIRVLNDEEIAQEIRISLKIRIEQRGDEYRVSVVSRSSGEWPAQE